MDVILFDTTCNLMNDELYNTNVRSNCTVQHLMYSGIKFPKKFMISSSSDILFAE